MYHACSKVMVSPVIASDGHSYEEHAIKAWLGSRKNRNKNNPRCGASAVTCSASECDWCERARVRVRVCVCVCACMCARACEETCILVTNTPKQANTIKITARIMVPAAGIPCQEPDDE